MRVLELGTLDHATGAATLLRRALALSHKGEQLLVRGDSRDLGFTLDVFARSEGHRLLHEGTHLILECGGSAAAKRAGARRAGGPNPTLGEVESHADPRWGVAARGALLEAGGSHFDFTLLERDAVWAEEASSLYRAASAAQWDPETAIPWAGFEAAPLPLEEALVQVLTYLIENETTALLVPTRLLPRVHPHFRETLQLLAIQAADEARHIEVFTRRATLSGLELGTSTVAGRASLKTLLEEHEFSTASLLLSVLGEGTFLSLLRFLERHAPDSVTRSIMSLAAQDEARHVAFAVAHLRRFALQDPAVLSRLSLAVERRHGALAGATGLSAEVFDALVVLAGAGITLNAIEKGHARVQQLLAEMETGRAHRLEKIGFEPDEAARLAALHTLNLM